MEALGRQVNFVQTAAGAWINVTDCGAVTFFANNSSSETYTITQAKDSSGTGSKNLATVTTWYSTKVDGTAVWAKHTQAAAATVANGASAATAVTSISVDVKTLDTGFKYVKCAVNNSGTVVAVLHDIDVQRPPASLIAPGA
jgi:hypothetical protein